MEFVKKANGISADTVSAEDLAKINRYALTELTADDVFLFKLNACDDQPDRDMESFSAGALAQLASLYIGKPVIFDHSWSAINQTARVFDSAVTESGGVHRLTLRCYALRNEQTQGVIDAIKGGILREVSVGCALAKRTCSICGQDYYGSKCLHMRGEQYDGKSCVVILDDAQDAYEVSFVAVPAQREAGVTKSAASDLAAEREQKISRARLAQQKQRAQARAKLYSKSI